MPSTRTAECTATDTAVEAVVKSESHSERAVIDELVDAVLAAHPGGGLVDSHRVAEQFLTRRLEAGGDPCRTQTRNYIQYLFRETAEHVCRHAEDGHYRIHPQPKCSEDCDKKHAHTPGRTAREHCEFCFMELTLSGTCPMDC